MYNSILTVIVPAMPLNVVFAIALFGIAYAIFTLKLQRKLMNPGKTREIQSKIQLLTKEMNEMAKRNEDISSKQAELMPLLGESMKSQMKGMFVILPFFFIVYYGIIPMLFGAYVIDQFSLLSIPLTYGTIFIATAIAFGLVMSFGILIRDKLNGKKPAAQPQQVQSTNTK